MSDNWIKLIPTDQNFLPSADAAEAERTLLAELAPDAEEVTVEFLKEVAFVDSGENWEGVSCPSCSRDASTWWADAMDGAAESSFRDLEVAAPCCGATVSLNDLNYEPPNGFASFILSAWNPNLQDIPPAAMSRLVDLLGTQLRRIWVRY